MGWLRNVAIALVAAGFGAYLSQLPNVNFRTADIPPQVRDGQPLVSIVTGANTGIGYHTALELARKGGHVILACRSKARAEEAIAKIRSEVGESGVVEFMEVDLGSLASVRAFTEAYKARGLPLHVLVANGGIASVPFTLLPDSAVESVFGVNYLGHALLIADLLPVLEASAPSRVVIVSSRMHLFVSGIDFAKLNDEASYSSTASYAQSKLALNLLTRVLARVEAGKGVYVNAAHPGFIPTEMTRYMPPLSRAFNRWAATWFGYSQEDGAVTQLYLATSPEVETKQLSGQYFVPLGDIGKPSSASLNDATAATLMQWTVDTCKKAGVPVAAATAARLLTQSEH